MPSTLGHQLFSTQLQPERSRSHPSMVLFTGPATKLKQVEDLSDPDQPRLFHAPQCSQCGGPLDLPSVHFMCKHSFHQRSAALSTFPFCLSLFLLPADAWVIMILSAPLACARTA
jgi:hypothetical protein